MELARVRVIESQLYILSNSIYSSSSCCCYCCCFSCSPCFVIGVNYNIIKVHQAPNFFRLNKSFWELINLCDICFCFVLVPFFRFLCADEFSKIGLKVARSGFWVTIPFNFNQLLYHHKESDEKSIVMAELEKDQSFWWNKMMNLRNACLLSEDFSEPCFFEITGFPLKPTANLKHCESMTSVSLSFIVKICTFVLVG